MADEDYYAAVASAVGSDDGVNDGDVDGSDDAPEAVETDAPAVEPETGEAPAGEGGDEDGEGAGDGSSEGEPPATGADAAASGHDQALEPDGDDAGILEGLSGRAKARFERLTTELRDTREQADGYGRLRGMLNEHIDSPETFATLLDFSKAMKAGDWQAAARIYQVVGNELAVRSGQALPQADPLAEFPDLQGQVSEYGLSQQQALELARARKMQQAQALQAQRAQESQRQQAAFVQRATAARDQVAGVLQQLERADPDFRAKMQQIAGQAEAIESQYAPEQWAGVVKLMYGAVKLAAAPRKPTSPQPLRPVTTPGKTESRPTSAYEAVLAAFK